MVDWESFIVGLKKILTGIKEDEEKVLRYILGTTYYLLSSYRIYNQGKKGCNIYFRISHLQSYSSRLILDLLFTSYLFLFIIIILILMILSFWTDNSNTNFINQHKFSEFLKGFGPVRDCVKNVCTYLVCMDIRYFVFNYIIVRLFVSPFDILL